MDCEQRKLKRLVTMILANIRQEEDVQVAHCEMGFRQEQQNARHELHMAQDPIKGGFAKEDKVQTEGSAL